MTTASLPALFALLVSWPTRAEEVASWDFAYDDGGFTSVDDAGQWQWGEVLSGPGAGYLGDDAWATRLSGEYLRDGTDYLLFPTSDLSGLTRPVLTVVHWYQIEEDGDLGWLEAWNGETWAVLEPVYGYPETGGFTGESTSSNGAAPDWVTTFFDLSGVADTDLLRFGFHSTTSAAVAGWYLGRISVWDGDIVPPHVENLTIPGDTQDLAGPYEVATRITDDTATIGAELHWAVDGNETWATMNPGADDTWSAGIDGSEPDEEICWWVEATDGLNVGLGDVECFHVYLAAPTGLAAPDGRHVGSTVELDWEPPAADYEVTGYLIYRDGEAVAEVSAPPAEAPVQGPVDTFTVSALFDTPRGEREGQQSAPLTLDTAVPAIASVEPAEAWQGEQVRVTVRGSYLLLAASDSSLNLGEGVELDVVEVVDANTGIFTLSIAADAAVGLRDVVVVSGDETVTLADGFEVLDGATRPAIDSIAPDSVAQGDTTTVRISLTTVPAETPVVDLGDDVLVEDVQVRDAILYVDIAVANGAPLGPRAVTVDDGIRVMAGAALTVTDRVAIPDNNTCSTAGARTSGLLWVLLPLLALRRRP